MSDRHDTDYDRTHFAPEAVQRKHFRAWIFNRGHRQQLSILIYTGSQLALAKKFHLPLFLHSRAAHSDLVKILREEGFGKDGGKAVGAAGGVVHSFTGTAAEAAELVRPDLQSVCIQTKTSPIRWTWVSISGPSYHAERLTPF
jgi:Tat protein secretion system quality control protein TatD with DNase activity